MEAVNEGMDYKDYQSKEELASATIIARLQRVKATRGLWTKLSTQGNPDMQISDEDKEMLAELLLTEETLPQQWRNLLIKIYPHLNEATEATAGGQWSGTQVKTEEGSRTATGAGPIIIKEDRPKKRLPKCAANADFIEFASFLLHYQDKAIEFKFNEDEKIQYLSECFKMGSSEEAMRIHIMTILRRSNDLTFKNLITEMLDIKAGGLLDVGMWTDLISEDDLKHKYSESVTEFATRFINVSTLLREFTPMRIPDRVFLKLLKPQIKGKMLGERSLTSVAEFFQRALSIEKDLETMKSQTNWKSGRDKKKAGDDKEKPSRTNKSKNRSYGRDKPRFCNSCKKKGHTEENCWELHPEKAPTSYRPKGQSNSAESKESTSADTSYQFARVPTAYATTSGRGHELFYAFLDSASNKHVNPNRDEFIEFKEAKGIINGIGGETNLEGVGTTKFTLPSGISITLTGVEYVPSSGIRLISTNLLVKGGGCTFTQTPDATTLRSPKGKVLIKTDIVDMMTPLYVSTWTTSGAPVDRPPEPVKGRKSYVSKERLLEHIRLGHIPTLPSPTPCDGCRKGKMKQQKFSSTSTIPADAQPGEAIVSDLITGLPPTRDGETIISVHVDVGSQAIVAKPIKYKNQATVGYRTLAERIKNSKGHYPIYHQSDKGTEYMGKEFNEYLTQCGTRKVRACTNQHNQNALVESLNRVILDGTRTMLATASLPECLWDFALKEFVRIRNSYFGGINRKVNAVRISRIERLFPEMSREVLRRAERTRVFGCIGYVLSDSGSKLHPRGAKCINLGCAEEEKGWWILPLEGDRKGFPTISRNVKFYETEFVTQDEKEMIRSFIQESADQMADPEYDPDDDIEDVEEGSDEARQRSTKRLQKKSSSVDLHLGG